MKTEVNRFTGFLVAVCLIIGSLYSICSLCPLRTSAEEISQPLEKGEVYDYLRGELRKGEVKTRTGSEKVTYYIEANVLKFHLTKEQLQAVMQDLRDSDAYLFYLSGGYSYSISGDNIVSVMANVKYSAEELETERTHFEEMANELYALGNENWNNLETALFYHDYLAANYEYDTSYAISDAYGFLEEGKGVCQAYTLAYSMIMEHFGIPCTYASSQNMNHIWNLVYLDGGWYHVDVTHDDPIGDRPGQALHKYFLTGSDTTAQFKENATDMVLGGNVKVSANDHPFYMTARESKAPFVEVGGKFYGILQNGTNSATVTATLSEVDLDTYGTYRTSKLEDLSTRWRIPGENKFYVGCYSGLAADERCLYYNNDSEAFCFDLSRGEKTSVGKCDSSTCIYGLRFEDGKLAIYTSTEPSPPYVRKVLENAVPTLYTITWVLGETSVITYAKEGEMPEFNGSTERYEDGKRYTFIGWSPEVVAATQDATYTALYHVELLYTPGDVNGDKDVNIVDVTALLNYLSDRSFPVDSNALDPDGDGQTDIGDVTALLSFLADGSFVLY